MELERISRSINLVLLFLLQGESIAAASIVGLNVIVNAVY